MRRVFLTIFFRGGAEEASEEEPNQKQLSPHQPVLDQDPFMFLKLELSISNHITMMLNLTQDLTMLLEFVSQILIDRRLFPFWWYQLCTILGIVFTGENIFNNSRTKSTRTPGAHGTALLAPTLSAGGSCGRATEGTC